MQAVRQLKGGEEISSSYIVRNFNVQFSIYIYIYIYIWLNNSHVQSAALEMFLSYVLIMVIFNVVNLLAVILCVLSSVKVHVFTFFISN